MLPQQGHLLLSSYTDLYDLIIPKDHLLRKMKELVDFSFVREELANKYCLDNGRMAVDPVCMFKYLLLKTIYNLSDVDIVERARVDMSFKYFLDMVPEADVINPSSLTKFRRLRLKDMDLLDLLINKTVSLAIDKGIIKATYTTLIIDATHTASRSNPCRPIEVLKMRSRELRKSLYAIDEEIESSLPEKNTDDDLEHEISYSQRLIDHLKENEVLSHIPLIKEKLNLLRESLDDIADRYTTSVDSDARVGHKSKESSFFGFKTHLAITQERLITGAVITSGEKSDGEQLAALIEQSEKNGVKVDTVIADTAYSGIDNLKLTKEKEIDLISKLNPTISYGSRKEEDKFFYNKDAGMFVCPAGHMAVRMQRK
ncbi:MULTISPECIES: transposase, partial [unclassified Parabacteroides]|uniref:transposase n=1 Tax=unclassified Parabacteroides TaxID=2649774 RepID=UPI0024733C38